jgi:hypothetical protein
MVKLDMGNRDFPGWMGPPDFGARKAVCKRCHCVMDDRETSTRTGEFCHPGTDKEGKMHWCPNANKVLTISDSDIEPFLRKRDRRRYKRLGVKI